MPESETHIYDFIIVGQGIAGSMLVYFLLKQNKKVVSYNWSWPAEPVDINEGSSFKRSYDGVNVPAVCVSVPIIFTTAPCARSVPPAPVVTFVREKSDPMKLSVTDPDVRV